MGHGAEQEQGQEQEQVSLSVAAKALDVHIKTIQRYIKKGLLTGIKSGNRTYVLIEEVKRIHQGQREQGQRQEQVENVPVPKNRDTTGAGVPIDTPVVPIERSHYEGLLFRLGALEERDKGHQERERLLIEYKTGLELKDKELESARLRVLELEEEKAIELEQVRKKIAELETAKAQLLSRAQKYIKELEQGKIQELDTAQKRIMELQRINATENFEKKSALDYIAKLEEQLIRRRGWWRRLWRKD